MAREELKPLGELLVPDRRMSRTWIRDRSTGATRPYEIADHYARYAAMGFDEKVPDEVASSWTAAQHLAIYAFYAYAFVPFAMLHALSTLELALRLRLDRNDNPGLRRLLREAGQRGLIDMRALLPRERLPPDVIIETGEPDLSPDEYWEVLADSLSGLRNMLAHGSHTLLPDALVQMDVAHRIIQQAYAKPANT
jgi:hypothetical protein